MKSNFVLTIIRSSDIRLVGSFSSLNEAYCFAEEIIYNVQKTNPDASYSIPSDGRWKADFDPIRYDINIPIEMKILPLQDPSEFQAWYAPKR